MSCQSQQKQHLIVGAGVSGIDLAIAFEESGYEKDAYVIYEASGYVGGVWNTNSSGGVANSTTSVQSDPVIYSPLGWFKGNEHLVNGTIADIGGDNPFRGIHPSQEQVMKNIQELVEKHSFQDNIHYHRKVLSFEYLKEEMEEEGNTNKDVRVVWQDTKTEEVHQDIFAGVHFRTGRLNQIKNTPLPNETNFNGPVVLGGHNEPSKLDFVGKTVAVVGCGAFAIENVVYGLRNGAKKIHVLARNDKPHWFDYATYTCRNFYSTATGTDPEHGPRVWDAIFDINTKASQACGVDHLMANDHLIPIIEGKRHYYFSRGGLQSFSFDPVALGIHYGIVQYHRGSIQDILCAANSNDNTILLDSGEHIEGVDIIIKCTGFDIVADFLKDRYCTDGIFVDGHANVTTIHGIDGIEESTLFGPCMPATSGWLLSIYALHDFNKAIIYFMKHPEKFQEFKTNPLFGTCKKALDIGMVTMNMFWTKMFAFNDMNVIENAVKSMNMMQEEYANVLDEQMFLKYDKMHWDTWSEYLAEKTGKPLLGYPFAERIKGTQDDMHPNEELAQ